MPKQQIELHESLVLKENDLVIDDDAPSSFDNDKPRGASPLGQFLLVGPLFVCVEKVRGRK